MATGHVDTKAVTALSDWQEKSSAKQIRFYLILTIMLAVAFSVTSLFFFWSKSENHDLIVDNNAKYVQSAGILEADLVENAFRDGMMNITHIAGYYQAVVELLPDMSVEERLQALIDRHLFDRIGHVSRDGYDITLEGVADVSDREYFKKAMNGENGYEFLRASRVTGQPCVVFYAPIMEGETIEGVMIGFYEAERLNNLFSIEIYNYLPDTYLLMNDGTMVANSRHSNAARNMFDELAGYRFSGDTDFNMIMDAITHKSRTSIMFEFVETSKKTSIGVITQLQNYDWMILSILPSEIISSMLDNANHTSRVLLIGISVVFVVLIMLMSAVIYWQSHSTKLELAVTKRRMEEMAALERKQSFIIDTLADTYSSVYHIDVSTGTYERIEEKQESSLNTISVSGNWLDTINFYTDAFVEKSYQESLSVFRDVSNIEAVLGDMDSLSVEFLRADGGWRKAFLFPASRDDSGKLKSVIFAVHRIDAEKQKELEAQKALQEAYTAASLANSAKTSFLSNMSHDIRTPMNAIIGMTKIAASHIDNKQKVSDCLKKINSASMHLLSLINEILDMSKIESGKVDLNEEEFSLSQLIEELIDMNQVLIREKGHRLTVHVDELMHEKVIGDKTRLQQVFTNLLTNAIKYTPNGGELEIVVSEGKSDRATTGCYQVEFRDNGIGMSREYMENLFEPFIRARDQRIASIQGTGLGMPIARNIVRMMNGDITVESELNKGSSFKVSFELLLQKEKEEEHSAFSGLSVLMVDDDPVMRESACAQLKSLAMRSESAESGEEALEMVRKRHESGDDYYAVLIDWEMTGMNGAETARAIRRAAGDQVKLVIQTSHDWQEIGEEAEQAGIDAHISKPLFRSKLVVLFDYLSGHAEVEEDVKEAISFAEFSGKRVLLVEDNELNMEIAVEILSMMGLTIDTACDGREGVERFEASAPGYYDMIFMDVQMPVMNGYEATGAIRALNRADAKTVPIVAMTANAFSADVRAALDAGMNDHVAKPIHIDNIIRTIEKFVK